ncbi:hypothetical protein WJX77_004296 [Trebouxia sp. C0004]
MPPALQQILGCSSDGVYRYIAPNFPKLLITSYNFVQEYCSQETTVRGAAETNLNMVRQGTAPIKPETKGTGSIPVRSATVPVATVPGRAAAGPARPRAAKGRAGPALVGKATHQKAASGPAVGSVSSGASRVAPVTPIWAAAGPAIGKVFPTHGSQAGLQRDAVLPGRAAARPTEGNVGSVKGRVGSSPGRVIHAPRLPSGHVQARQASQRTTEPEKQLNNHTAHLHGRGQNSQAKATHVNQLRTPVMTVPQHHQPAAGNARNAHETNFSSGHNSYRGKFPPANNTTQFGHGLTEGSSSGEASSSGDGSGDGASSSGDGSGGVSRRAPAFRVRVLHGEQEQKNAIWHYNNKAKTAEAACSIARSLELSIGQSSTATRACALDWYLKVTKSRAEGQVKQYAERRIAELQDLIAGSLGGLGACAQHGLVAKVVGGEQCAGVSQVIMSCFSAKARA